VKIFYFCLHYYFFLKPKCFGKQTNSGNFILNLIRHDIKSELSTKIRDRTPFCEGELNRKGQQVIGADLWPFSFHIQIGCDLATQMGWSPVCLSLCIFPVRWAKTATCLCSCLCLQRHRQFHKHRNAKRRVAIYYVIRHLYFELKRLFYLTTLFRLQILYSVEMNRQT
jgi:hypothetical protein